MHDPTVDAESITIAAGSTDITPTRPVCLAGIAGRTEPFVDVAQPLEASAIVIRQGAVVAVVVSVEALHLSDALMRFLLERCPELDERTLWLAATHTHFAPALDESKPALGRVDEDHRQLVFQRIAALVLALLAERPVAVTMARHEGTAAHAINRRKRGWSLSRAGLSRGTVIAPNERGPRDDRIHAVSFVDDSGAVRAVLWSMACHPVCSPDRLRVSSDYPGWVRRHLRRAYTPDLPVVFLQGFAGNLRPRAIRPRTDVLRRSVGPHAKLNILLNGATFGGFDENAWTRWAHSLAVRVADALSSGTALTPRLAIRLVEMPISELADGPASTETVHLRALHLSEDLVFVAISAEPVVEYRLHVERAFAPARTVPVGYTDHVFGYLPTARMLEQGGYEVGQFRQWFEMEGAFTPLVETRIREGLAALAASTA